MLLSFLLLASYSPSRADEPADARAIVDQAIEAMGGREALAQYQKPVYYESQGKAEGGNGWNDFTMKVTLVLPEKFSTEQESLIGGKKQPSQIRFNGEKSWHKSLGSGFGKMPRAVQTTEGNAVQVEGYRDKLYAEWLATLLPLDDGAFKLAPIDEITIDGRPAVGIKVTHADRPDVRLYFDKVNFTVVKFSRTMQRGTFDEVYNDFAELDGLVHPKKIAYIANGKKIVELEVTKLEFLDTVDDATFEKP